MFPIKIIQLNLKHQIKIKMWKINLLIRILKYVQIKKRKVDLTNKASNKPANVDLTNENSSSMSNMNSNNQQQQQQLNIAFSSPSMPNSIAIQNLPQFNNLTSFNSHNMNENGPFLAPLNQYSSLKLNQNMNFNNQQQHFQFHNNSDLNYAYTPRNPQNQPDHNQVFSPSPPSMLTIPIKIIYMPQFQI